MKLSIVMATYNGEKYIVEQMDSLRIQSRPANEVLIFDDRSTDKTVEIIKEYISKYNLETWKLTINEQNKGWRKNFVDGMKLASGDLIFPCDQDDIWMSEKLEKMEAIMETHPKVGLLMSSLIEFYENEKEDAVTGANDGRLVPVYVNKKLILGRHPGCTYCIRRPLIRWYQEYWESCFAHDTFLWFMSRLNDKLYYYGKPLIRQRRYEKSASAIESAICRTREGRLEWIKYYTKYIQCLMLFLEHEYCEEVEKKKQTLENWFAFINRRIQLAETGNLFLAIRLYGDMEHYTNLRQYLGDIFFFVLPEWLQKPLRRFI